LEVCPHCGGSLRKAERGLYTLRRRKGLWQVVFDGQAGQFKHEKGAEYVARLLVERGPIHALELGAKAGGAWHLRGDRPVERASDELRQACAR
jgi:hypothetical protein